MGKSVRVLVVDDSAYSRRSITRMLDGFRGIRVVGYAANGEEGIRRVIALRPDLVTLDLDMPGVDGFTLLRILTTRFSTPVVVVSALGGGGNVFKALELGALDFVAKPTGPVSEELLRIRDDLRDRVLATRERTEGGGRRPRSAEERSPCPDFLPGGESSAALPHPFDVVAIGASTGGPPALQSIFSAFERPFPFAVAVAQHMPPGFTRAFAQRLDRFSPFAVKEAADGDELRPGRILIAPGGKNLLFESHAGRIVARTVPPGPDDRYTPSVDALFASCAGLFGRRLLAVVLTGMGNDGSRGVRLVKQRGGLVLAESAETAVVYGMPREAAATGLVDRQLPLHRMAREILLEGAFL